VDDLLTIVFRVAADNQKDQLYYFSQRFTFPPLKAMPRRRLPPGRFRSGEGSITDWLMRDRSERVVRPLGFRSRAHSEGSADELSMAPGVSSAPISSSSRKNRRSNGPGELPLNVKVLVNLPRRIRFRRLCSRSIPVRWSRFCGRSRANRGIGKFSIIAFNMQEQRVIYRQREPIGSIFPLSARRSLNSVWNRRFQALGQKHGDTEFLTHLIQKECGAHRRTR